MTVDSINETHSVFDNLPIEDDEMRERYYRDCRQAINEGKKVSDSFKNLGDEIIYDLVKISCLLAIMLTTWFGTGVTDA